MRLLTHNFLMCNKKGVENGFPLKIKPQKLVYEETEFNAQFTTSMVHKLEYDALLAAIEYFIFIYFEFLVVSLIRFLRHRDVEKIYFVFNARRKFHLVILFFSSGSGRCGRLALFAFVESRKQSY